MNAQVTAKAKKTLAKAKASTAEGIEDLEKKFVELNLSGFGELGKSQKLRELRKEMARKLTLAKTKMTVKV